MWGGEWGVGGLCFAPHSCARQCTQPAAAQGHARSNPLTTSRSAASAAPVPKKRLSRRHASEQYAPNTCLRAGAAGGGEEAQGGVAGALLQHACGVKLPPTAALGRCYGTLQDSPNIWTVHPHAASTPASTHTPHRSKSRTTSTVGARRAALRISVCRLMPSRAVLYSSVQAAMR